MHPTLTLFAACLVATSALAQGADEWSTFPPAPAKTATPDAGVKAAPAAPAPAPAAATPAPRAEPEPSRIDVPRRSTSPAASPAPAPAPSPSPTTPAAAAEAKNRTEDRLREAKGEPPVERKSDNSDKGEPKVISQQEKYLAGTEPHSPGTASNKFDAASNGRVTVGAVGIGGFLTPSARLGPAGVVRVSVLAEYLNQTSFPVRNASDIRSAITFAASWQILKWAEVFVSYAAAANTNNRTSPNLIQSLGDLSLGLKASNEWAKGFHAGADVRFLTFSGVGNQSVDKFAFGVKPSLMIAYDFRAASSSLPFILNASVGFTFDSTSTLVTQRLNASEEFALNVNKYNRFNFGAILEVPLPFVMPFVEYSLGAPLGVTGNLTGPDGSIVPVSAAMPQLLGLGLKITALKDLTLVGGVNIGLSRSVGLGVPATPPWNLLLGAQFAIDPFQRGETKIVETLTERRVESKVAEAAKPTRVEGTVTDVATKKPLANVVVSMAGQPPAATDAQGRFVTVDLGAGVSEAKFTAAREGYKAVEQSVKLQPGAATKADFALQLDAKPSTFDVFVTAAKKAVKASVAFKGPQEASFNQDATATGPTTTEVAPGMYSVIVTADGFLAQNRDVQLGAGTKVPLTFELQPAPKQTLVVLKGDKLEIMQQVHFATGKATILADSYPLLQQVVDVSIKNNIKRIRIEGHTDNRGVKAVNQKLSEDRAAAVVDYLVAQGIDRARLESVGFGDSKPMAPNLTAKGRELNRRVEFIVTEK